MIDREPQTQTFPALSMWPEKARYAAQNERGDWCFYQSTPIPPQQHQIDDRNLCWEGIDEPYLGPAFVNTWMQPGTPSQNWNKRYLAKRPCCTYRALNNCAEYGHPIWVEKPS